MKVNLRERGGTLLSASTWDAISRDPGFARLVDKSILSAEPAKGGRGWRLKAGAYVGRATLGGVDINVLEKVPGAFNALVSALAPRSFRFAHAAMKASLVERPDAIVASMLVAAARTYLSQGGEAVYLEEHLTGAYVTGRLDVRRTVGLRARGVRHRVAFTRNVLDDDTPLNRAIYGALGILASPSASLEFGMQVTAAARAIRSSFGLSAKSVEKMTRKDLREEAASVAEASSNTRNLAAHEAAVLASAVLEGAAISGDGGDRLIPKTWFVSLEELFERLVCKLASDVLQESVKVGSASKWPRGGVAPPLFREQSKRYPSNADLIIDLGESVAIGDAKYKNFDGWPGASDIHQLVSHAAACHAYLAALFYPSDGAMAATRLGPAATGCHVWAFALDLTNAEDSMREALLHMELPVNSVRALHSA